jgi:hypothetical protein
MQNYAGQRCNFMIVNGYLSRYSSFVLERATLVTTVTSPGNTGPGSPRGLKESKPNRSKDLQQTKRDRLGLSIAPHIIHLHESPTQAIRRMDWQPAPPTRRSDRVPRGIGSRHLLGVQVVHIVRDSSRKVKGKRERIRFQNLFAGISSRALPPKCNFEALLLAVDLHSQAFFDRIRQVFLACGAFGARSGFADGCGARGWDPVELSRGQTAR